MILRLRLARLIDPPIMGQADRFRDDSAIWPNADELPESSIPALV